MLDLSYIMDNPDQNKLYVHSYQREQALYTELKGLDNILFGGEGPIINEDTAPLWDRRKELCIYLYPSHCRQ